MIKLYVKFHCPFCRKVMARIEELQLKEGEDFEIIDADNGSKGQQELVKLGGKAQVPFLVDGDTKMYESDDIISYLNEKFTK